MTQEGEPVIRIGELLVRSGVITATDLSEAEKLSSHMKVQFGRLLIMAGCLTEEALECALEAQGLCRQGLMTSDIAIEAVAFAVSENISLQDALEVLDILPQFGTSTLKLAELIHDANIIDEEKLQDAFDRSMETNQALAEVLVEMQCITPTLLPILKRMQDQIRTETLDRDDAINELRGTFKIWKKADKALSEDPMTKSAIIGSKLPGAQQQDKPRFTSSFDTVTRMPAMTVDTAASITNQMQSAGNAAPPPTSSSEDIQPLSPSSSPTGANIPSLGYVHPGEKSQPPHKSAAASGEVDWVLHHYGAGGIAHPAGHPARIQPETFSYADDDEQRISDLLDIFASEAGSTAPQPGRASSQSASPVNSSAGPSSDPAHAPRPVSELLSPGSLAEDVSSQTGPGITPTPPGWIPNAPHSPSSTRWPKVASTTATGEIPSLRGFGRDTGNGFPAMSPFEIGRAAQPGAAPQPPLEHAKPAVPPAPPETPAEQPTSAPDFRPPGQPKSPRKGDQTHGKGLHAQKAVEDAKTGKGLGHPDRAKEHRTKEDRIKDEAPLLQDRPGAEEILTDRANYERPVLESNEPSPAGSTSRPVAKPITYSKKLGPSVKKGAPAASSPPSPAASSSRPSPVSQTPDRQSALQSEFHDELARQLLGESDLPPLEPVLTEETGVGEQSETSSEISYEISYEYPSPAEVAEQLLHEFEAEVTSAELSGGFVSTALEFLSEPTSVTSGLPDQVADDEFDVEAAADVASSPSTSSSGSLPSLSNSGSFAAQLGTGSGEPESLFSVRFRAPDADDVLPPVVPFNVLQDVAELPSATGGEESFGESFVDLQDKPANRLEETRARRVARKQPIVEPSNEDAEPGFSIDFTTESERAELEALERELDEKEFGRAEQGREGEEIEAREEAAGELPETEANEAAERERQEIEAREAAERERQEIEAREAAEREREEIEAREAAEREREETEAREAAEREREETEAREAAERERQETEAREAAERERQENEAREAAERERLEAEAREAAEIERQEAEAREAAEGQREEPEALEAAQHELHSEMDVSPAGKRSKMENVVLHDDRIGIAGADVDHVDSETSALSHGTKAHQHKKHKDEKQKAGSGAESEAEFIHMLEAASFFSEGELHEAIAEALTDPHKAVEILSTIGVIDRSYLDAAARLHKLIKTHAVDYDKAIESLDAMREGKLKPADLTNQLGMKKPKRRK